MAGGAIAAGIDVLRWLSFGHPAIVAMHTVAGHFRMIHPLQGQPAGGPVATVTLVAGWRVIGRLAFPSHPVMADDTGGGAKKMIKAGNAETPEVVALTTIQVGRDVSRFFAAGKDAIVALPAAQGGTTEDLVTVAISAVDGAVRALKGKGRSVVIELGGPHSSQRYLEGPCIVAGTALLPGGDVFGCARCQ